MSEPARIRASYQDLYTVPENMTGEIIDGELIVAPRPSRGHVYSASSLGGKLVPPYQFGEGGGPGGWILLIEPEIGLGENILVPDLAGWRKERFPTKEETNWISVQPDWICEILSPSTRKTDKVRKMPIYAQYNVLQLWLVEPMTRTLDVFGLEAGRWALLTSFTEDDKVRAAPFHEVEFDLGNLWMD